MTVKTTKRKRKIQKFTFSPHHIAMKLRCAIADDFGADYSETPVSQLYMQRYREREIFSNRMINEFLKKFTDESSRQKGTPQSDAAKRRFFENCDRLSNLTIDLPDTICTYGWRVKPAARDIILFRAKNLIENLLGTLSIEQIFEGMKHSSGTTRGLNYEKTNLDDKMRFPITATRSQALLLIQYWFWDTSNLKAMLKNSASVWTLLWELDPLSVFEIVEASSGTTVPKNDETDRFIGKETTAGMFIQKGIEYAMYRCLTDNARTIGLKHDWVDVTVLQDLHRKRALQASITGKESTIDWSNASDNWLRSVVKWLLPPDWYDLLVVASSPRIEFHYNGEFISLDLPMISTMGNAFTFPLETMLFYTLALACVSYHYDRTLSVNPLWEDINDKVSVFGDDCILPTECSHLFIELMESLGHQCNLDKSYMDGSFRESCGGDFYNYRNVRPFNLTWPAQTAGKNGVEAWLYIISNRLFQKYKVYFGDVNYIYHSVFDVLSQFFIDYEIKIKLVPDSFPDDSGLKLGLDFMRSAYRRVPTDIPWVDRHGTVSFKFLGYNFPSKYASDDHVRYWYTLKYDPASECEVTSYPRRLVLDRVTLDMKPDDKRYIVKRGGHYVVRNSVSPVWSEIYPLCFSRWDRDYDRMTDTLDGVHSLLVTAQATSST